MLSHRITRLSNRIAVLTERIPSSPSASVGVWLDIGSRDESLSNNGISHLYEHMVFKGTHKRTGLEIVRTLEEKGGQVNAYTTKEQTCFYARVVTEEVPRALDVLLDMVLDPIFDEEELRKEREVVIEELKGCDDNPDERVYDLFGPALFGKQSLSYPIAGTVESVEKLKRVHLKNHLKKIKTNLPVYVVVAGNVNHSEVVRLVREVSQGLLQPSEVASRNRFERLVKKTNPIHLIEQRNIQQANILMGTPSFALTDKRCMPQAILNCILGDGMSSRLFQRVREDYGYVYHINTYTETLVNGGMFNVSFSMEPAHLKKCFNVLNREFSSLKKEGITVKELEFAKANIKGAFQLEIESTHSKMNFLARSVLSGRPVKSKEQILEQIEKVTLKQVNEVIQHLFQSQNWGSALVVPNRTKVDVGALLSF